MSDVNIILATAPSLTSDGGLVVPPEPAADASEQNPPRDADTVSDAQTTTMAEQTYLYKVKMTCGGCSGAINRVLTKAQKDGAGVTSFDVSLENQTVEVVGTIAQDDLTQRIAKTGKTILEYPEPKSVEEAPAAPFAGEAVSVA